MNHYILPVRFTLNGRPADVFVSHREDAVDLLKRMGLFGARESCGQGLCGCCTIKVDGLVVSGCLTLARLLDGTVVETVEDLNRSGELSAVQRAFIDEWAFQCGFCTPGFIMMAEALLDEHPDPTDEQIVGHLSGNLCRCATYPEVVQAVKRAAHNRKAHEGADQPRTLVRLNEKRGPRHLDTTKDPDTLNPPERHDQRHTRSQPHDGEIRFGSRRA